MTTHPDDEHGETLRRALHAEAETVTPVGDGLERIRARIADGHGRRFGLGRFGLARYGMNFERLTVDWARPVLAVAAAMVIAGLGVTAPQTIDLIQQSVGSNGPAGEGRDAAEGEHTSPEGDPQFPAPPSPGVSGAGAPSTSPTPTSTTSPGMSACRIPPAGTPTPAASPGTQSAAAPPVTLCPSQSPSQTPTTSPPPATPTPPDPDPTEQPTPSTTSEEPRTSNGEEGAPSGGGP
ncbi:hypothetical protein BZB76_3368 [Actinomadura pelletieri DSM 43383]|uniref:Uncharacterized protein n=1 Tax=Actinomadura pelletieri DSM 43383 TaxID=1120940 RepID=A0A495QPI3_9ACTN|nr:hypothetical protein [Actinomadura pelletieri]RKS74846.1 hypothetical protein BZB76_3368 [Actinomadura pelletieri DSM 43383]